MNSPLGKYAQIVAAITAVGVIGAYIVAVLASIPEAAAQLKDFALLALGAVFGSAVAVNGYKAPLAAANKRLDKLGAPPAGGSDE